MSSRLLDQTLLNELAAFDGEFDDDAIDVADFVKVERAASAFVVDVGAGRDQFLGLGPFTRTDDFARSRSDVAQGSREAGTAGRTVLLDGKSQQERGVIGLGGIGCVGFKT